MLIQLMIPLFSLLRKGHIVFLIRREVREMGLECFRFVIIVGIVRMWTTTRTQMMKRKKDPGRGSNMLIKGFWVSWLNSIIKKWICMNNYRKICQLWNRDMSSFAQNLKNEVFINWLNRKKKWQCKKEAKGKFSK